MLEGVPGAGAESCEGFPQKQPQRADPSAAAAGGRGRPPHARPARDFQLFRGGTRGASGGHRAQGTGQGGSALYHQCGTERSKSTAPLGTAPLCRRCPELQCPGTAGASATGDTGDTGTTGAAGREMPCRGYPGRVTPFPTLVFRAGEKRGAAAGAGVAVTRSASPQTPLNEIRPSERPWPPPAAQSAGHRSRSPPGQGQRGLRRRAAPRASFGKETGKTGKEKAFPGPGRQSRRGSRAAHPGSPSRAVPGSGRPAWAGPGGCRSRTAPSPAPPAAATSPLQLAAWLFCLIKLNVSVNFPPGRAALPLPEPECWLQMSTRPIGAAPGPWRRAAPATRGHGRAFPAGAAGPGEGRARTSPGHSPAMAIWVLHG